MILAMDHHRVVDEFLGGRAHDGGGRSGSHACSVLAILLQSFLELNHELLTAMSRSVSLAKYYNNAYRLSMLVTEHRADTGTKIAIHRA